MTAAATPSADVIVAGAGHNSLITAAYLTRAGHRCLVLDGRPVPGGGVASEELLLPGYRLDSCSTGHTLIQTNPVLADDELGLIAEHGLTYIEPDPVAHVVFPDGESITMWLDLERTCEEIARFDPEDAGSYRNADRVVGERKYQILADVAHRRPAQDYGARDACKIAFNQSNPGTLDGDFGPGSHGDANSGFGQSRGIIHAVTRHCDDASLSRKFLDDAVLILR